MVKHNQIELQRIQRAFGPIFNDNVQPAAIFSGFYSVELGRLHRGRVGT